MLKKINARVCASLVLTQVKQGVSFQTGLVREQYPKLNDNDCSQAISWCFEVLRYYHRLKGWLYQFITDSIKEKDSDIEALLLIGLYQLYTKTAPDYAIINESVKACELLQKQWAKGLINGVLRNAQRHGLSIQPDSLPNIQTAHPNWLTKRLKNAWPDDYETIIEHNLMHPPFSLRVNTQYHSREDYLRLLQTQEIDAHPIDYCNEGIIVKKPTSVQKLPGFNEGWVSVQDGAAQLCATLIDLKPHLSVLDACSAPGGKMAHLLEKEPLIDLTAVEKEPKRFIQLQETQARLKLNATLYCHDANDNQAWWDKNLFDVIILDAPCSGVGVIRRHPDIKLHRKADDLTSLINAQQNLLNNLWPLLKPGGILIYVTCSILPEENVDQIQHFIQFHKNAQELKIEAAWGRDQDIGKQILPGDNNMDGFYFARLQKIK